MDLGAFPLTKININKKPNTKTCEPFTTKKKNNNNNIKLKKKKKTIYVQTQVQFITVSFC